MVVVIQSQTRSAHGFGADLEEAQSRAETILALFGASPSRRYFAFDFNNPPGQRIVTTASRRVGLTWAYSIFNLQYHQLN